MDKDKMILVVLAVIIFALSLLVIDDALVPKGSAIVVGRVIIPLQLFHKDTHSQPCKEEVVGRGIYTSC